MGSLIENLIDVFNREPVLFVSLIVLSILAIIGWALTFISMFKGEE
jgi:hypothetical protein